jgi:hypothetical protein
MRLAKEERRTRRQSGVGRGESEARKDVEHGPRMVDVDPWAVLLEQLLEGPTEAAVDQGGPEDRPTTAAQPEAGAAVRPKRPKKGKGGNGHR